MPGPGLYDNFKINEDRGKKRACTIGKRWTSNNRSDSSPGPGKYNISQAAKRTDNGGHGQSTNKRWKFGTENRKINQEAIKKGMAVPSCAQYSPEKPSKKLPIT